VKELALATMPVQAVTGTATERLRARGIGASGGVLDDLPKWNVFQDLRVLNPSSWANLS
jgi:hypothetical protein